jgi:hydroxymethylglutaryl-CoA reductase (NADPH)
MWSRFVQLENVYLSGFEFVGMENGEKDLLARIIEKETERSLQVPSIERVPYDKELNYDEEFVKKRREWLSDKTHTKFNHIAQYSTKSTEFRGNIENFVGTAQVPIGIVGPLLVKGDYAKGMFYVPFATTEGAMVETYQRGAIALTKAGGVRVFVNKDMNYLDPYFLFESSSEAKRFTVWLSNNFNKIKEQAEHTTKFGKLVSITPYQIGKRVALDIAYFTSDAMGANMINIATEEICNYICHEVGVNSYCLRSNLSSEKKASGRNMIIGYGKEVIAEAVIPEKIINRFLFTTSKAIADSYKSWALCSLQAGMIGMNAHFANGSAAVFIACGQDVAHVANVSVGIMNFELTEEGDLYLAVKLPNIIVGTIGGGTALGTQKECLEMIGCYGKGKSKKFAEILGAVLLAGELGISAGATTKYFLDPHKRARTYTRSKAYELKDNA